MYIIVKLEKILKVVIDMLEFEEYKARLNAAKPSLELLQGALKLESARKEVEKYL